MSGGSPWGGVGQLPRELGAGRHEVCEGKGVPVAVYEPALGASEFFGFEVARDLKGFKARCDFIVANR